MPAATSQEYPLLNGYAPSWADIITTINVQDGPTIKDIDYAELKWSSKVSFGEQRGASGGRVIAQTTGSQKDEGSCVYYKSGLWRLLDVLADVAPVRGNQRAVSAVRFNITILHTPYGSDVVYHEFMRGCRLASFESSMKEGDEAEQVPMDLAPMQTGWIVNGKEIVLL